MPSYSLTLREEKGFKLTTQELDENFLYVLQNASGGSGANCNSRFDWDRDSVVFLYITYVYNLLIIRSRYQ